MTEAPHTAPVSTLRNAGSSLAQLAVATLSLFVLYRVVLDVLGPREFGIWSLVVAATSLVGLSNMGLTGSIVKHVADSRAASEVDRLTGLIETTVISVSVLSVVLAVAGYPLMKLYFAATLHIDAYRSAVAILPVALVAFCLSMITGIYQSALYGCHLIYQRNAILIFESLSFLALSVTLAPRYGLSGLVYARAFQNLITLILSIAILKRHIRSMALVPRRWKKSLFKEMIGYALSFQFISLLNMLMDPLTKGMLSRFGSLEMVTYFEMSTRLIGQARGIVVNANQVLVPTFAQVSRNFSSEVAALFSRSYSIIFYVTICLFGFLVAALPLICLIWLGAQQPIFIKIGTVLSVGWLINTLSVPAYFASLGTGMMREVVGSHIVMSMVNLTFGLGFGALWGGYGVVAAWGIALSAGGLTMHLAYCRRSGLGLRFIFPAEGFTLLAFCGIGVLAGRLAMRLPEAVPGSAFPFHVNLDPASLLSSSLGLLCFLVVFSLPAMLHPVRSELFRWVFRRRTGNPG